MHRHFHPLADPPGALQVEVRSDSQRAIRADVDSVGLSASPPPLTSKLMLAYYELCQNITSEDARMLIVKD